MSAGKKIGLESIPRQIGDWKMTNAQTDRGIIKNWEFLNEVLMRVYTRSDGESVWLAITYGSDQRQTFTIHLPEGCYRAAGFDVESVGKAAIFENGVEVKKLISRGQGKTEPISYWVMLDGKVVTSHLERKFKQLYYTIFKKPAYGALVRISSLAREGQIQRAYAIQADFIRQFAQSLSPELKEILFGDMQGGRL